VSARSALGDPTRGPVGDCLNVAVISAGIVIGTRRDPGIADIGRLLGNSDERGLFRRGTGCEQRKCDEQSEAANRYVVSEPLGGSVICRMN
jgi:hypothetical protein